MYIFSDDTEFKYGISYFFLFLPSTTAAIICIVNLPIPINGVHPPLLSEIPNFSRDLGILFYLFLFGSRLDTGVCHMVVTCDTMVKYM